MTMPNTNDEGFYASRDFNIPNNPLLYTAERSKLQLITEQEVREGGRIKGTYYASVKLDGKYIRVIKKGKLIRMITSGHKDFYHNALAECFSQMPDGQYMMELVHGDGRLKSRNKTGHLTTAYTLYSKCDPTAGDWVDQDEINFVMFDYLHPEVNIGFKGYQLNRPYSERIGRLAWYAGQCKEGFGATGSWEGLLKIVTYTCLTERFMFIAIDTVFPEELGYDRTLHEGLVFRHGLSGYELPLSHTDFKMKNVLECVGTVVDVEMDKHQGNGTLIVEVGTDEGNMLCRVSSGINNAIRGAPTKSLIGKLVEIEYESLTDKGEFNLPRIKRFDV